MTGSLVAVNVARVIDNPSAKHRRRQDAKPPKTGIDKRPVEGPVRVESLGLDGDSILDVDNHGGAEQALYAYAEEDGEFWRAELGETIVRPITPGVFGENLTTRGVDVSHARIGERWRVGDIVVQVTSPRIPCSTFAGWFGQPQWVKRFARAGRPGAYLRVVEPGVIRAGDPIEVIDSPGDAPTIASRFADHYAR